MTSRYLPVPVQGSGNRLPVLWVPPAAPFGAPLVRPVAEFSLAPRRPVRWAVPLAALGPARVLAIAAAPSDPIPSLAQRAAAWLAPVAVVARWARRLIAGAAVLAVVLVIAGSLLGTWGLVPVLTGSMRPGIQPGDLVLVVAEPLSSVRVGQIIDFQPPGEGGAAVVHRVTQVRSGGGGVVISTKGDANDVADPWHSHLEGTRAWRVRAVVPKLGYLAVAEHNPGVRLMVEGLLLVGGLMLALQVVWSRPQPDHSDVVLTVPAPGA